MRRPKEFSFVFVDLEKAYDERRSVVMQEEGRSGREVCEVVHDMYRDRVRQR